VEIENYSKETESYPSLFITHPCWTSDVPALVRLGIERGAGSSGTSGIMRKAILKDQDYWTMWLFKEFEEQIIEFQNMFDRGGSAYFWVAGDRGSGKSELIEHLFKESLEKSPENSRIPIYVSVSDKGLRERCGESDGQVSMKLFDYACRDAIKTALEFIKNELNDEHEQYGELRGHLDSSLGKNLSQVLSRESFSMSKFAEYVHNHKTLRHLLRFVVFMDDLDKIHESIGMRFFEVSQTDFSRLKTNGVAIVSSVTREFVEAARQRPGLNYCLHQGAAMSNPYEFKIPNLDELTNDQVQNFLESRFRYLHQNDSGTWTLNTEVRPHEDASHVIEHDNWSSFDIRKMRQNGALMALNTWIAREKSRTSHPGIDFRTVLRTMEVVLNGCETPREELTAWTLEGILKSKKGDEVGAIRGEIQKRVNESEISLERITADIQQLYDIKTGGPILWGDIVSIIQDKISLGSWETRGLDEKKRGLAHRIKHDIMGGFDSNNSCFMVFGEVVEEICIDSEFLDSNVVSRSTDEICTRFGIDELISTLEKCHSNRSTGMNNIDAPKEKIPAQTKGSDSSEEGQAEAAMVLSGDFDHEGIIGMAYLDTFNFLGNDLKKGIEEIEERDLVGWGEALCFHIVEQIIKDGRTRAARSIVEGEVVTVRWADARRGLEKSFEENRARFVRRFLSWLSLRCSQLIPLIHTLESQLFSSAIASLTGENLLALNHHAKEFEVVIDSLPSSMRCMPVFMSLHTKEGIEFPLEDASDYYIGGEEYQGGDVTIDYSISQLCGESNSEPDNRGVIPMFDPAQANLKLSDWEGSEEVSTDVYLEDGMDGESRITKWAVSCRVYDDLIRGLTDGYETRVKYSIVGALRTTSELLSCIETLEILDSQLQEFEALTKINEITENDYRKFLGSLSDLDKVSDQQLNLMGVGNLARYQPSEIKESIGVALFCQFDFNEMLKELIGNHEIYPWSFSVDSVENQNEMGGAMQIYRFAHHHHFCDPTWLGAYEEGTVRFTFPNGWTWEVPYRPSEVSEGE